MKTITLGVIAVTISIFSVSCSNNNATRSNTTDTTSTTTTANQPMPAPPATQNSSAADTVNPANNNNASSNMNTGDTTSGGSGINEHRRNKRDQVVIVRHVRANYYAGDRSVSPAVTGNTNGIKSDIKADSIDNNAGFGAGK